MPTMKSKSLTLASWLLFGLLLPSFAAAQQSVTIRIDGAKEGRTFEGIGAVSAGASSRLLVDYPAAQRAQILDFLFKPNHGASFQHLKVEIGSDANSTDGTEPSFARTHTELVNPNKSQFDRGYEFWLMKEARARNRDLYLDALEWAAPGWVGSIYSPNNLDYLIAFVKGAKAYHQLDLDFIGIWNERPNYTAEGLDFVKNLRTSLDRNDLGRVKIVGLDAVEEWSIATHVAKDPALKTAIGAIGIHYPSGLGVDAANKLGFKYKDNAAAQATGLPLYSSEDGPWTGTWDGAKAIARMNNRNYIVNKITKTEYWSPVTSYYDVLSIPGSGVMTANQPWSGHYTIQPALWAVAHTTQFARPGWKYVDSGCGLLDGGKGSYVTLKSPDRSGDYSIIIETTAIDKARIVRFKVANLSGKTINVWKSDAAHQFIRQAGISPTAGSFSIRLEPGSIYSMTTTTGQSKGESASPPSRDFPKAYRADFSKYDAGSTPRYFQDQVGAFEVYQAPDEPRTLRQMLTTRPISWAKDVRPNTIIGGRNLVDYTVDTEARIENDAGEIGVMGRISAVSGYEQGVEPNGYALYLQENGSWSLRKRGTTLATGSVTISPKAWQRLSLSFAGKTIRASINGAAVAAIEDSTYASGLAGLATGWNTARFKNLTIN